MSDSGMALTVSEAQVLEQPNTMNHICAHILQGGSLVDLAETWAIPFGRIRLWMQMDDERDKAYIKALNMRAEFEGEKIKREMSRIAYADFRKIYNKNGSLKPFVDWPTDVVAAVQGLKYEKGKLVDFKRADTLRALELAGKTIAMFSEKLTLDGKMNLEEMLVVVDRQARAMMAKPVEPKAIDTGDK